MENLSLKEIKLRLVRELLKYKCPLNAKVLDVGESASVLDVWKPQFFIQQVNERFYPCVSKILSFSNRLEREPIYARDTDFVVLSSQNKHMFFDTNHILGSDRGTAYALVKDNTILASMIVKPCCINTTDKGSIILTRFATNPRFYVVGGFNKLMHHAFKETKVKRWVSYADLMFSQGNLYSINGWNKINIVKPDYRYLYNGSLYHKFNFRIKRFKEDKDLIYQDGLTERELAELNGLVRVYDIGKIKYEFVW